MSLDRISAEAQRLANRDGKPFAVYNLNRIGAPMYVIRSAPPAELPKSHIATFYPAEGHTNG